MFVGPHSLLAPYFNRNSRLQRPKGPIRVRVDHPMFGGLPPFCAWLFGEYGFNSIAGPNVASYYRTHSNHVGLVGDGARFVADDGGSDDDAISGDTAVPSVVLNGSGNAATELVIGTTYFYHSDPFRGNGVFGVAGCRVQSWQDGSVDLGYDGGNGYACFDEWGGSTMVGGVPWVAGTSIYRGQALTTNFNGRSDGRGDSD